MPRSVEHAKIETPTSRAKLTRGKRHYQLIVTGKSHIGYKREDGASHGRWFLRRNLGGQRYQYVPIAGMVDNDPTGNVDPQAEREDSERKAKDSRTRLPRPGGRMASDSHGSRFEDRWPEVSRIKIMS